MKSTMMDWISVDQMILKCYQQLAVFIFGFGSVSREDESGLCVAIDGGDDH